MTVFKLAPQPTDQRNVSQGDILNDFTYLQTSLGVDHNFTGNTATAGDGYHDLVHLTPQSTPANDAGNGQIYAKTGTTGNALHFMPSTGSEVQLSLFPIRAVVNFDVNGNIQSPSYNVASVTRNPGGLGTYVYKVNFSTALPSANFVPFATCMRTSIVMGWGSVYPAASYGTSVTSSFCIIAFTDGSAGATNLLRGFFMAVGG